MGELRVLPPPPVRDWMTKAQVAEHLQVSVRTVDAWRTSRGLPAHKRGGLVRFDRGEVDEWVGRGGSIAA